VCGVGAGQIVDTATLNRRFFVPVDAQKILSLRSALVDVNICIALTSGLIARFGRDGSYIGALCSVAGNNLEDVLLAIEHELRAAGEVSGE
jgi:hypothetical protein